MRRIQLFEFEDLPWFPDVIRRGGTDYLRYLLNWLGFYKPVAPMLIEALNQTGDTSIIDLCSGGGGGMEQVVAGLDQRSGHLIKLTLSDKFPNTEAFCFLSDKTGGRIGFCTDPVDALNTSPDIKGFRTMFSAVHHFSPRQVEAILQDAARHRTGIALFDGGDKNLLTFLAVIVVHPIIFFLVTPFFKPFTWSRLFFTYIIPLIPLMTIWDGCISILRLYSPGYLLEIAKDSGIQGYTWNAGKRRSAFGMHITYLVGIPDEIKR